jgi:serine/threonine protein kinase
MARDLTGVLLKEKWRVDGLLGEGGVAAVYSATHRNGKRVAVKVLHPQLASVPEVRERFLREGYLANRIDHPGAVGVTDDDITDDGLVFLVMDLLVGESLEKRLAREGRLPPRDVLAITDTLLDVLAAAHAKGIVHRDIKPENIFLLRDGGQKLLDFGIARLQEQANAKNATQTGAAMGTPSYMPPEQARGRWEMVDARSDIWAVGATMFALLTGQCVHEAETLNETLLLAMAQPARPLASVWPEAPPAIAAIVDRALAFDMNGRWADAAAMRAVVKAAAGAPESLQSAPIMASQTVTSSRIAGAPVAAVSAPHLTPAGPRGTVLTGAVDRPLGPAAQGPFASTRGRAALAAAVGGLAIGVVVVALTVSRGKSATPASPAAALPPSSGATSPSPNGSAVPATAAQDLPSAILAPLPSAAPSASVAIDVSQLPTPTAPTTAGLAPTQAPTPTPAPVARAPLPTPRTANAPSFPAVPAAPARPSPAPTSNPLDRRH